MKHWWSVSILLTRADGRGGIDLALRLGNWQGDSEEAVRGAAIKHYMDQLPGYGVDIVLAVMHAVQADDPY